jgi:hypothetical protein
MASRIAWLDASDDDQRRMREILLLFTDQDSRDELGIGSVRDALSDGLFPGTSTLLTRARYLLFIPWCFQLAAGRPDPLLVSEQLERRLITALRDTEDFSGLMGIRRGEKLKTLPSGVYWATLRHYRIVRPECETRWDAVTWRDETTAFEEGEERRVGTAWSPTLPAIPDGFPEQVPGGFTLTTGEAGWLRDRLLERAYGTLLAHLVENRPDSESRAPWLDEAALGAKGAPAALLDHARQFSVVVQGAALLYNLLLAEEYEQGGNTRLTDPVDDYRTRLSEWADRAHIHTITNWNTDAFWIWYAQQSANRLIHRTRLFIDAWVELLRTVDITTLADNQTARNLIRQRERSHKGAQARLGNRTRISQWQGSAGTGQQTFRWTQVRRILLEIHDGLARDA